MNLRKFLPLASLLFIFTISLFLSGCALNSTKQGDAISQNQLSGVQIGASKNDVLAKFGEPSRVSHMNNGSNENEDVWFYCWSRGTGGVYLDGLIDTSGTKSKCATFIFNDKGKLLAKGIGKGSNNGTGISQLPSGLSLFSQPKPSTANNNNGGL